VGRAPRGRCTALAPPYWRPRALRPRPPLVPPPPPAGGKGVGAKGACGQQAAGWQQGGRPPRRRGPPRGRPPLGRRHPPDLRPPATGGRRVGHHWWVRQGSRGRGETGALYAGSSGSCWVQQGGRCAFWACAAEDCSTFSCTPAPLPRLHEGRLCGVASLSIARARHCSTCAAPSSNLLAAPPSLLSLSLPVICVLQGAAQLMGAHSACGKAAGSAGRYVQRHRHVGA
jgi:hypothetical protein